MTIDFDNSEYPAVFPNGRDPKETLGFCTVTFVMGHGALGGHNCSDFNHHTSQVISRVKLLVSKGFIEQQGLRSIITTEVKRWL